MFRLLAYIGGGSNLTGTTIMLVVMIVVFFTFIRSKNNKSTNTSPSSKNQPNNISDELFSGEKVLIRSEQYSVKKLLVILVLIGLILSVLVYLGLFNDLSEEYYDIYQTYQEHMEKETWDCKSGDRCFDCRQILYRYSSRFDYINTQAFDRLFYLPAIAFAFIGGLIFICLHGYELTVTDKRIYGKVAGGKRVDLPVDSVSATGTIRLLKGISISTSSGKISFRVIKNADEIYSVISNLLIERQQAMANSVVATVAPKSDEADQLKKYKDLLDQGVITQEEFDAKKKQLLGL